MLLLCLTKTARTQKMDYLGIEVIPLSHIKTGPCNSYFCMGIASSFHIALPPSAHPHISFALPGALI